jgi:hypothetical protein
LNSRCLRWPGVFELNRLIAELDFVQVKCGVLSVVSGRHRHILPEEETKSNGREGRQRGLISNRREAVVAVLITTIVLASAFRSAVAGKPQSRWLFKTINHSYLFGRPASIALSVFLWFFVGWILFWFYRAGRDKNERFLVGGFAVGFVLGIIGGFLSRSAQINLEFASTAAFLVSFASSLKILAKPFEGNQIVP